MKRLLLQIGRWVLILLLAVAGILLFLSLTLASRPGEKWLNRRLTAALSDSSRTLVIGRLETNLTSRWQFHSVALFDPTGRRMTADRTTLTWRPFHLLSKSLPFQISADRLVLSGHDFTLALDDVDARGRWVKGAWHLDSLTLRGPAILLTAQGVLLPGDSLKARGRLTGDLSLINLFVDPADSLAFSGPWEAELSAHGSLSNMAGEGEFKIADGRLDSLAVESLSARFAFADNRMTLSSLNARLLGGTLFALGEADLNENRWLDFQTEWSGLEVGPVRRWMFPVSDSLEGTLGGTLQVRGAWNDLVSWDMSARWRIRRLWFRQKAMEDARGTVSLEDGKLKLHASQGASFLRVNAALADTLNGTGRLVLDDLNTASSFWGMNPPLSGYWSAEFLFSGHWPHPRLNARFIGRHVAGMGFKADTLAGRLDFQNGIWRLDPGYLSLAPVSRPDSSPLMVSVSGQGNIPNHTGQLRLDLSSTEETGGLTARAKGDSAFIDVRMAELAVLSPFLPPDWQGRGALLLAASLNLKTRNGVGSLRLGQGALFQAPFDSLRVDFSGGPSALNARGQFTAGPSSLSLEAAASDPHGLFFSRQSILQGTLAGELDAGLLAALFDSVDFAGRARLDLSCQGPVARPRLSGFLQLSRGRFQLASGAAADSLTFFCLLEDSTVRVEECSGRWGELPFDLKGDIFLQESDKIKGRGSLQVGGHPVLALQGEYGPSRWQADAEIRDFYLELAAPFLPGLAPGGRLNGRFSVVHDDSGMAILGDLQGDSLTLQPPGVFQKLTRGVLRLRGADQQIFLDTLGFHWGGGRVACLGQADLSGMGRLDISGQEIRLKNEGVWRAGLKRVRLNLIRNGQSRLQGVVVPGESRITQSWTPAELLRRIRLLDRPAEAPPAWMQNVSVDIRIDPQHPLWIDNNFARADVRPALRFTGTMARLRPAGRVSIQEGYVLYLDRKFQVERGSLDILDPLSLEKSAVDFSASAQLQEYQTLNQTAYTVKLGLSGTLAQPRVTLSSSPPLEEPDIVSLLTLGATRRELTASGNDTDSGLGLALRTRAQQYSSQRISGFAARNMGTWLGLDRVTIQGDLFQMDKTWGPEMVAAKKLTPRMTLYYRTTVGHANDQAVRLNYRLSPSLFIEGETDQEGKSGVDLKFRIKLK